MSKKAKPKPTIADTLAKLPSPEATALMFDEQSNPLIADNEKASAFSADGVALISAAHPGSDEISEDAIETIEIEVKNERFDRAVADAVADQIGGARVAAWMAGRDAALAMIRAELQTDECKTNHQAWTNCVNALIIKVAAIRIPEIFT